MTAGTRRRSSRPRLRLALWTLPFVLIALLLAAKLFSLPLLSDTGSDAYQESKFQKSVSAFDGLMVWNGFEPWIAHFDRGTAFAADGQLSKAVTDLTRALELAPEGRTCEVRVNLALAWEQQGDAHAESGSTESAIKMWTKALGIVQAGDEEGCDQPQDSGADQELDAAEKRLKEKLEQSSQSGDESSDSNSEGDESDDSGESGGGEESEGDNPFDDLEKRGEDAERKKQNGDAERRGGSGGGTDKPW
ncbi:hypothetical protein ACSAGD_08360 [Paramicrobacterium sp. CJ85]|uniref:hypothetical protein n=1 Tax=Paramicrobacterium sp. CJ85 TaxID=3445355 RepID=UPI003F609A76